VRRCHDRAPSRWMVWSPALLGTQSNDRTYLVVHGGLTNSSGMRGHRPRIRGEAPPRAAADLTPPAKCEDPDPAQRVRVVRRVPLRHRAFRPAWSAIQPRPRDASRDPTGRAPARAHLL